MTPRKISDLKNYDDVRKMRFDYDDCRNEIEQMLDEQFFSGAHIEEMLKLAATILKNQKVLHDTEFEKMVNDKANTEVLAQYLVSNYYFSEERKESDLRENSNVTDYKQSVIDALVDEYLIDEVQAYDIVDRNLDALEVCEVDEVSPKDCAHLILSEEFEKTYDIDEAAKKKKNPKKIGKVMGEFKRKTLKSGSGKKVTDRDQALAIAYSEAGMANEHYHGNFRAKRVRD